MKSAFYLIPITQNGLIPSRLSTNVRNMAANREKLWTARQTTNYPRPTAKCVWKLSQPTDIFQQFKQAMVPVHTVQKPGFIHMLKLSTTRLCYQAAGILQKLPWMDLESWRRCGFTPPQQTYSPAELCCPTWKPVWIIYLSYLVCFKEGQTID